MRYEGGSGMTEAEMTGEGSPTTAVPTTWVPTDEAYVYQRGEGDEAEYKVQFPDGEVQDCGMGDEAYLGAPRIRDEMARNRGSRGVLLAEVVDVKIPPSEGDEVLIEGRLVSIDGVDGHVSVGEEGTPDYAVFAVAYDTLRKYDRPEEA